jgi:PAS domain S-box-containing protein
MALREKHIRRSTTYRASWTAVLFFFGTTVLAWIFSEQLAIIFLYDPYRDMDPVFFLKAQILLVTGISIIVALISYIFVLKIKLFRTVKPPPSIPREVVSDLMLSREQFRKLYESSPVPYFLIDDAGNIRNPNNATLRFFGGTIEDCTSANFYSLLAEEGQGEETMSLLKTKVERAVPVSQEEMAIHTLDKDVTKFALMSIYSLDRSSPIPFKHLVTLVDVTKEKESERVKTDFLLLASHQLRTPLTTIKWYIDYLLTARDVTLPAIVKEYLEQIYIGNERMIELITTLLTVSRIEMGTLAPEYTVVHMNEIVRDILDELATDIKKKNTKIVINTDGHDALTMDYTMTRIIVHNLLTNAVKYTPSGGTVTINSEFSAHSCTISVSDTGYGIPIEEQEKIFTKMFRATNARKVSANGTGLGLYMSRAFTEKLGGNMSFTSVEGQGTTFSITLPRVAPGA